MARYSPTAAELAGLAVDAHARTIANALEGLATGAGPADAYRLEAAIATVAREVLEAPGVAGEDLRLEASELAAGRVLELARGSRSDQAHRAAELRARAREQAAGVLDPPTAFARLKASGFYA